MDNYRLHADRYLTRLADRQDDELTSAVEAWALADALSGGHDDTTRDWWPRLVGRPAGAVRSHSRAVREARPELRQTLMTKFSREVPCRSKK